MMNAKKQISGDNSTNIQADGNINISNGMTYSEVRQIAIDVFDANFTRLRDTAHQVALERAETITDKFLQKLMQSGPEIDKFASDPDFQHSLFIVQREYAKSGDKDLGSLLIDLLIDRSKVSSRTITQIVLNESLNVAPKLTQQHIDTLSLVFVSKYVLNNGLTNIPLLKEYIENFYKPYIKSLSKSDSCYQHLAYTGCGSISALSSNISDIFRTNYGGLFSKGFSEKDLEEKGEMIDSVSKLLIRCIHDNSKYQFSFLSKIKLDEALKLNGYDETTVNVLVDLYQSFLMNDEEIIEFISSICDEMKHFFDVWNNSGLKRLQLTSVGIAIGHANIKKDLGEFADLSTWIN